MNSISYTSTKSLTLMGVSAAVLAVISQIAIPLPTGVPITIQVFGIALVGTILGWKQGCIATLVYILLGCVGLPIFSNFTGGLQCLTGMTGGYILAWPVMAVLSGIHVKHPSPIISLWFSILLAVSGLMVVELVGAFQWSLLTSEMSFGAIMAYSFVAFIPKDIILTILAVLVGTRLRQALVKAGSL